MDDESFEQEAHMIFESTGKITEQIQAIGRPSLPGYLILGEKPVLIESGMIFMGPHYVKDLRNVLGDENQLCYNFLTHSHYDHAGASPYLKKKIQGLKLGAHRLAAETLAKPSAIELIRSLSRNEAQRFPSENNDGDMVFSDPHVDILLEDGMEIDLGGGLTLKAIATPGHTRDAMSYYIPQIKALFPGEAFGTMNRLHHITIDFLSSYRAFISSMEKLAAIDCEILMLAHHYTLTGEDAQAYVQRSIRETKAYYSRFAEYLNELHGDQNAVVQRIYQEDYVEAKLINQAIQPYMINVAAMVKVVAEGR